ncbi:MAG: HDOD domain-containing protein [Gammaproteobacteria bacterium]|nr:HDOD domain-containing protein [Gammaproteobacteria bacterium]
MGFVLRNLFKEKIHTALLTRHAQHLWEHSVEVGAIAQVLAEVTPGMSPEFLSEQV